MLQQPLPFTVLKLTNNRRAVVESRSSKLQQPLPFTVLKPTKLNYFGDNSIVATALTVYGIETINLILLLDHLLTVATALTVYGIETNGNSLSPFVTFPLQQPLPFTVLKLSEMTLNYFIVYKLQQPLPFTVLKLAIVYSHTAGLICCNSPYRLRY